MSLADDQIEEMKSILGKDMSHAIKNNYYITMLLMCRLAYYHKIETLDLLDTFGANKAVWYKDQVAQALYIEFKDFDVLAFRGVYFMDTDDFRIISAMTPATYLTYKVHHGFGKALDTVNDAILLDVRDRDPNKRLIYTGHSMGGALAKMFAMQHPATEIVTFGAPRVFEKSTPDDVLDNVTRVVTQFDVVKHLPPAFLGYKHIGKEVQLPAKLNLNVFQPHAIGTYLSSLIDMGIDKG